MKKLAWYFAIPIFLYWSCSDPVEVNDSDFNDDLVKRGIVMEEYIYNSYHYKLYFNEDDTSGIPLNESTEDSIIAAIGSNDVYPVSDLNYPDNVFFLENVSSGQNGNDTTFSMPTGAPCYFFSFYSDSDFQGDNFCFSNQFFNEYGEIYNNGVIASQLFQASNLANNSFSGGGTWNDKISSFKIYRDGPSREWYDSHAYTGINTGIAIWLHRDSNYSMGRSKVRKFVISLPFGTDQSPKQYSNLKDVKWSWIDANLNDKISSISFAPCSSSYSGCLTP